MGRKLCRRLSVTDWRRSACWVMAMLATHAGVSAVRAQSGQQPYGGLPPVAMPPVLAPLSRLQAPSDDRAEPVEETDMPLSEDAATDSVTTPSLGRAGWHAEPSVTLREAYTDNVRLLPQGGSGDFVSTLTPELVMRDDTRRLQLLFDGSVSADAYLHTPDLDGYRYSLYGNGLGEIIDKYLFIDARLSASQQPISPNGVASSFDRTLPGNQVEVINASISPYLSHDFGGWAIGELRYRASTLDYSEANSKDQTSLPEPPTSSFFAPSAVALSNEITNAVSANLRAGPDFSFIRWAFNANASESTYSDNRSTDQQTAQFTGEYAATRELAVLAIVGEDGIRDSSVAGGDSLNPSVRAGFRLSADPQSYMLVEAGTRYGGPYWSGSFRWRASRSLTVTAAHRETVTTQQQQANSDLNDLVRTDSGALADSLTGDIVNPNATGFGYSNRSFTLKTSQLGLTAIEGRSSFGLTADYDQRGVGAISLGQSDPERQTMLAATLTAARQLTRKASLDLSLSAGRTYDSIESGDYTLLRATVTYRYALSPSLRAGLDYRHYSLTNRIGTGFAENAVLVTLRQQF